MNRLLANSFARQIITRPAWLRLAANLMSLFRRAMQTNHDSPSLAQTFSKSNELISTRDAVGRSVEKLVNFFFIKTDISLAGCQNSPPRIIAEQGISTIVHGKGSQ